MSLNIVRKQIKRFLATDVPEVMAIKGSWGVGKTYTWNKLLENAKENNGIALKSYSYVSLFGINSLEALKYSIFEQAIDVDLIGKPPCLETFKTNADKLLKSLSRKSLLYFQGIPLIKNFAPAIESASFLSINKSVICIDDFERKSDQISLKDILGLVLLLKEQRNCKIVLIFNDEQMGAGNSEEYKKFREKVIDFEIEFKPTSEECVEIALSNQTKLEREIGDFVVQLGINNIRIIKKIERIANILYPHLGTYEKEVMKQAIHTLCLYSLCFYSSDKHIPDYKYVKNIGYRLFGFDKDKEESEKEKGWNAFLREYGYQHADEFDLRIAEAVEKGYVNEDLLKVEAEKLNAQIVASKSEASFSKAWRLYHNSFLDNKEDVINALYNSLKQNAKYISPVNLNGTVKLFRELGEDKRADEMIEIYITAHKDNPKIFNLNDYHFLGDITDERIRTRFAELADEHKEIRSIKDVLSKIAGKNGWSQEDVAILANASPDEFYELFKSERGEHLPIYVDTCLQFGRIVNASDQQKKIAQNASKALERIARDSLLNKIRVRRFGIRLQDENSA